MGLRATPRPIRSLRAAILATVSLALVSQASAQTRPSTLAMTCREAAALVRARGAVLLGTGGQTFDRFVADRRHCEVTEVARTTFVPTRDTPSCPVGYRCVEPSRNEVFGFD